MIPGVSFALARLACLFAIYILSSTICIYLYTYLNKLPIKLLRKKGTFLSIRDIFSNHKVANCYSVDPRT